MTLCETLERLCDVDMGVCVAGDFNLPRIDWKHWTCPGSRGTVSKETLFLDLCLRLGLARLVEKPTRRKSLNILDFVLSNDDSISDVDVATAPFDTDRLLVQFTVSVLLSSMEEVIGNTDLEL